MVQKRLEAVVAALTAAAVSGTFGAHVAYGDPTLQTGAFVSAALLALLSAVAARAVAPDLALLSATGCAACAVGIVFAVIPPTVVGLVCAGRHAPFGATLACTTTTAAVAALATMALDLRRRAPRPDAAYGVACALWLPWLLADPPRPRT